MALGLGDFAGKWHIRRRIDDRRQGQEGRFKGTAVFAPEGPTLIYRETGIMQLGETEMEAEQSHVWRIDGTRIHIAFADGRPFHHFDTGVLTPAARHPCAPDLYEVTYDFTDWPIWRTEWTVTGPRKDYLLATEYRRVETGSDQAE